MHLSLIFTNLPRSRKKPRGVYNYEADYNPQYSFGHGLSYTSFAYSNLRLDKEEMEQDGELNVSVEVSNSGSREGKETVHLYTSDLYASSVTPDVKRLRRFEKISLKPGESKLLQFTLHASDLAYADRNGAMIVEAGEFELEIGGLKKKFKLLEDAVVVK